jgi:type II secretory pathway pseudopilin PulG
LGLVEIIVSMMIFGVALASVTPLVIGGLRASRTAQVNTQARALGQERIEKMRNLQYHVARQNGQCVDVLDTYYRDVQQSAGNAGPNDPCAARAYASGVYTCTITNLGAPYQSFTQQVRTRFLDANRNVLVPPSFYDSQQSGVDAPVSNLLGVDVVTSWTSANKSHSYTVHSQIANAVASDTILEAKLRISALNILSNTATGDLAQLQAGLLSVNGDVANGSSSDLSALTAMASLGSGLTESGAQETLTAPPAMTGTSPSDSSGHSLDASCLTLCFGQTSVTGDQNVNIANGAPMVSSATNPVMVALRRTGSNLYHGFSYSNADNTNVDTSLQLQGPMVSGGTGSTSDVAVSWGYLASDGTGNTSLVGRGGFRLPHLELFATPFAPNGVVQVSVDHATLSCTSGGSTSSVAADWSGEVKVWNGAQYVEYHVGNGKPALPDPTTVQVATDAAGPVMLSRYVQAWSALTSTNSISKGSGRRALGSINSIVSILTAPTRLAEPTSALNIGIGAMSCVAEDGR